MDRESGTPTKHNNLIQAEPVRPQPQSSSISGAGSAKIPSHNSANQSKRTISDAEARLLLQEETKKANQRLQAQEKKNKKTITTIIIVAIMICVVGLIFALVMGGQHKDAQSSNKPQDTDQDVAEDDNQDTNNEEEDPTDTLVQLSIEDAQVQQLYNYFGVLNTADLFGFYESAASTGQPSNDYIVGVAMGNVEHGTCAMPLSDETIQKRYADQIEAGATLTDLSNTTYNMGCYKGEDLRAKMLEIFGKEITLKNGEKMIIPGWQYSTAYDEVYAIPYVGGNDGFGAGKGYLRGVYEAWRDPLTDEIYLYEVVAEVSGSSLKCKDNTYCLNNVAPTIENAVINKEKFTNYRWTFVKNSSGNYVFKQLEEME